MKWMTVMVDHRVLELSLVSKWEFLKKFWNVLMRAVKTKGVGLEQEVEALKDWFVLQEKVKG